MRVAVVVACVLALAGAAVASDALDTFVNEEVVRTIDLSGHVVTVTNEITILSTKASSSKYTLVLEEDVMDALAHLEAVDEDEQALTLKQGETTDGKTSFVLRLRKGLSKDATTTVTVTMYLTHVQTPFPEEILQSQKQLVVFEGNVYFASPYATQTQSTTVRLPNSKVESYSKVQPASKSGDTITYGPYDDVEAGSSAELRVHYENNTPFKTARWAEREVEVSHWGNVAVEEHYEVHNTGAVLKGGFSRLDYQMKMQKSASFQSMMCHVPFEATELYYRDIIGNISTSAVRQGDEYQEMEVNARFPIFGGWKTQWYQGYNLPLGSAVSVNDDGSYTLSIGFGPSLVDVPTDELEVKVVLPEGAEGITVETPFEMEETRSKRFTYFDTPTSGRTVLSLKTTNFVSAADGHVKVTYSMPAFHMIREPLMIVGAIFVLFFSYILLSRVDLSIKA